MFVWSTSGVLGVLVVLVVLVLLLLLFLLFRMVGSPVCLFFLHSRILAFLLATDDPITRLEICLDKDVDIVTGLDPLSSSQARRQWYVVLATVVEHVAFCQC